MKENFLNNIDGAIYYRSERAKQYPDDVRNSDVCERLMELRANINAKPDDDALFKQMESLVESTADSCYRLTEWISDRLGRLGFDYSS